MDAGNELAAAAFKAVKEAPKDGSPHLIVVARAGTGKTSTAVEGVRIVKGLKPRFSGSKQQLAIWDCMALSRGKARSIAFASMGHDIAEELRKKVPEGCTAKTFHAMGLAAIRQRFRSVDLDPDRSEKILTKILGHKPDRSLSAAVCQMVRLCKIELVRGQGETTWREALEELADNHEVRLPGGTGTVAALVAQVLERSRNPQLVTSYDHSDMIWLPIAMNLYLPQSDILIVDEAQDLNRCQQELALRSGRRLIVCGDDRQAIFAFAGADSESLPRLRSTLETVKIEGAKRGCVTLPLTVSRRCGKAIVAEAVRFVPDFRALPSAPEAVVLDLDLEAYRGLARPGDLVMCRVNAPLVGEYFRLRKAGRAARILGRGDVDDRLAGAVRRLARGLPGDAAGGSRAVVVRANVEAEKDEAKERQRPNPNEHRLIAIRDRRDCIQSFCEAADTVDGVLAKINEAFAVGKGGEVRLSSIHKAKGLEARRCFLLQLPNASVPHPLAKSDRQKAQEANLQYVAVTRAIEEFCYVS